MRVRAAAEALACLALAGPALAAPPRSPPRDASPAAGFVDAPGIVFGSDGVDLLSWNDGEIAELATLQPDGTIGQRGGLPGSLVARPLAETPRLQVSTRAG